MKDLDAEELQRRNAMISAQFGSDSPAAREFNRARSKVFLRDIVAFLRGYRNHLLSFEELSRAVAVGEPVDLGVQEIPLDAVRGSVDRYRDFDLAFLPKHSGLRDRWERVATARQHGLPMPPIEVYKLGDLYFVRDGHHRVSVCRSRGDKTIQARVIELTSRVPLHPDLKPDDLPRVEAYADFVRLTRADEILPGVDLQLSKPKNYARLVRHIAIFRYLNLAPGETPRDWPEAMRAWYEQLYRPMLEIIERNGIMEQFPERTATDLYLWIVTNFRRLNKKLPHKEALPELERDLKHYLAPFW
ncbi:MAG: transcriptional regulator [Caldilineae bacterium]|nr:MAG: transcriptional regulator [Caldilineae bacterium]